MTQPQELTPAECAQLGLVAVKLVEGAGYSRSQAVNMVRTAIFMGYQFATATELARKSIAQLSS